ncbi:Mor transcription activator family protein [Pseudomonas aeruginosa]|nr:Mor transcription activator family protein [Pseudomonas aeruginosa]
MKEIRSQQIRRRNNMLSELAELIVEAFVRNGIPREKAVPESEEVAFQLHRRWAGLTFVFPVKDDLARKRLELHILQRYDGSNADKLVQEFGISEGLIYEIVRKHRRQRKDQMTLLTRPNEPGLRFTPGNTFSFSRPDIPHPLPLYLDFSRTSPRYFSPSLRKTAKCCWWKWPDPTAPRPPRARGCFRFAPAQGRLSRRSGVIRRNASGPADLVLPSFTLRAHTTRRRIREAPPCVNCNPCWRTTGCSCCSSTCSANRPGCRSPPTRR